jgi:molybdate transport system substrate-binding protein
MKAPLRATLKAAAIVLLFAHCAASGAAELVMLSSGASRSAVSELGQRFEKHTSHKVAIKFANNPVLAQRIKEGARFDVLIIEPEFIDGLIATGYIVGGSRVDLARVGMALGARAGISRLDTSTAEAFIRVLKGAESIAYTADGHSGAVFIRTLERLGVFEEMKPKLRPAVGRTASSLVLNGEAQMWAGPISTPAKGTQILGRFPEEVQTYIGVSAAISTNSTQPDVARSFVAFLGSSEAASVFSTKGFQQVSKQ